MEDKAHLIYLQNRVAYARDQVAYKELFLHFYPMLRKLAVTIIQQESLAEEIVSDVMTRVWTMETKLAYIDHLKIYLLTAIRNTAITYLKKHRREAFLPEIMASEAPVPHNEPDQHLATKELSLLIERSVKALPQQCQLVFRLIKEEGLSYKEAGSVLELSKNTLETHMRTALKRLRDTLDAYLLKKNS
ncbi:MAG: sigma-70 family RNA polymerase sigma factor [Flavisolibacter sp.]|nr:sigma-70 family RNA polymerase sigma factor [Flavisolibacter sp.]